MRLTEFNTEKKLITEKSESYWFTPDIFYVRLYRDSYIELEDLKEMVDFQLDSDVNVDSKRIVHAEKFATITKPAREYLQRVAPTVSAEAYVIPSLAQKILFNVYVKFRRNVNPIKAFDNLEDAIAWLSKY